MRARRAALIVASVLWATGCPPTLSSENEEFSDALRRATSEAEAGRHDAALSAYEQAAAAADRRVDREEALYREARLYERMRRPDAALAIYERIAATRPIARRTLRARLQCARMRMVLGREDEAERDLAWIVTEAPGSGLAARALFLLVHDFASTADERIAMLDALYPRVGTSELGDDILMLGAEACLERDDRACARERLERIADEHPYPQGARFDDALVRLAELAREDRDLPRAIGYLDRLLSVRETTTVVGSYSRPAMPGAALMRARLYRELGDVARALEAYEEAYDGFPTARIRDDALFERALLVLESGDRASGCELLDRLMREFEVGSARRRARAEIERACR
jgi:tetratricopeptide (TPR) repeat protein